MNWTGNRCSSGSANTTTRITAQPASIDTDVTVPQEQKPGHFELKVVVDDADNHKTQQSANVTIQHTNNKQ
jgi:hypothetical protein